MSGARIFISYRRDDASGEAGRLADHLQKRFGRDCVFLDIDTIAPGTDFVQVLRRSIEETVAVLVVIGRRWVDITGPSGARRLDDQADFVRLEVEAALARGIPVVPVLVQGTALPPVSDLPAALAPLVTRQSATLDHAEFHADAERLADRLAPLLGPTGRAGPQTRLVVTVAALAIAVLAAIGGYSWYQSRVAAEREEAAAVAARQQRQEEIAALLQMAAAQRDRRQFAEAVRALETARALDPAAAEPQMLVAEVGMQWLREAQGDQSSGAFGDAMKPALAIVDAAVAGASGARRADLVAHQGWATFLLWRDGDRTLRPQDRYREALAIDPDNPYANAMLAHWTLWIGDDVDEAARLFGTALGSGRATGAVRTLQWAAFGNESSVRAQVELIRVADAMRRGGEPLAARQSQTLWSVYYFALPAHRDAMREQLLRAVAPDDHLATLRWSFDQYIASDESRRRMLRYYAALLDAAAGRRAQARRDLGALQSELAASPGSLLDAVQAALHSF